MKHVFVINSHTTFMTAMGVIDFKMLLHKDVILIYTRNYVNSLKDKELLSVDLSEESEFCNLEAYKSRQGLNKCITIIDSWINNFIHESYELYFPHLQLLMCQLLYTNSLCIRGSFLQEGAICQPNKFISKFSVYEKIKNYIFSLTWHTDRLVRPLAWYQPNHLPKQNEIDSYSLSSDFFRYLPSKNHIIKWPKYMINQTFSENSKIFIFDGYVKNGLLELDYYMNVCKQVIKDNAGEVNYLKFHPAQSKDEMNMIISIFKQFSLMTLVLDSSVPFEAILSSSQKLNIVGFSSSLLKFAYDLGHNVSVNDYLLKQSKLYSKHIASSGFPYMSDIIK